MGLKVLLRASVFVFRCIDFIAPQGDIDWEELQDDPATAACRELLSRLDEEEAQETTSVASILYLSASTRIAKLIRCTHNLNE